jgi:hypothetical protein
MRHQHARRRALMARFFLASSAIAFGILLGMALFSA